MCAIRYLRWKFRRFASDGVAPVMRCAVAACALWLWLVCVSRARRTGRPREKSVVPVVLQLELVVPVNRPATRCSASWSRNESYPTNTFLRGLSTQVHPRYTLEPTVTRWALRNTILTPEMTTVHRSSLYRRERLGGL